MLRFSLQFHDTSTKNIYMSIRVYLQALRTQV